MAKLGQITYKQRNMLQSQGPEAAVEKYRQKQGILDATMQLGQTLADIKTEDDLVRATADHRQTVSDYNEWAAANPTATRDELKAWAKANLGDASVFDSIDTEQFDARGEEDLPQHLWFTAGLSAVMDKSSLDNADTIMHPRARDKWEAEVAAKNDQLLTSTAVANAEAAVKYEVTRTKADVTAAIESGDFLRAEELLGSRIWQHDAATRILLERAVFIGKKESEIQLGMISATSTEDFDELLAQVTNPEWNSGLSSGDTLRLAQSVLTQRNAATTAAQKAEKDREDTVAIEALIGVTEGRYTMADINSRAFLMGKENHARLITAVRTQSSQGLVTDRNTERKLSMGIMALRSGLYDGEFDDGVRSLQIELQQAMASADPVTGEMTQLISLDDASRLSKELASLRDFPYKTEAYSSLTQEMRDRILGVDEGGFSFMASEASRATYANAINDLRNYMDANGGAAADLESWRKEKLPAFLNEASLIEYHRIPESAQGYVVMTNGMPDYDKTDAAIQGQFTKKTRDLESGQITKAQFDRFVQDANSFYTWHDKWSTD